MIYKELIEKIKEKPEFFDIPNDFIEETIKDIKISEKMDRKDEKIVIKEARSRLRLLVGRFQKKQKERLSLLKQNKIEEILKTHSSTFERIDFYPYLKNFISNLNISSILDLGCGLNPLGLASKKIEYFAVDIKKSELELIKLYFKKHKINGKTILCDLRKIEKKFPRVDLCIIFKTLDIISKKPSPLTKKILKNIECKYLLISFSTKTLSGKKMKHPRRYWLENLLKKKYYIFFNKNEIFYFVINSEKDLPRSILKMQCLKE